MTGLVLAVLSLTSGATPKVVSPQWVTTNVKRELVAFYSDTLAQALRHEGLDVVTSSDIAVVIGIERQRQLLACNEGESSSCMTELANALGCDGSLTVTLVRFEDGGFRGVAKIVSSRDGRVLSSTSLDAPSERSLIAALERAGSALARPFVKQAPSGSAWWVLPASLSLVGGGTAALLFVLAQNDYHAIENSTDYATAQRLAAGGLTKQTAAWVSVAVGAAALVSVGIVLWLGAPADAKVALAPAPNGFVVMGRF